MDVANLIVESAKTGIGRGDQARVALLMAGLDVFGETSLESATTRQIASRAKQNIAAIAYYFGNKEGLYRAVIETIVAAMGRIMGPLISELEAELARGNPTPKRAVEWLKRLLNAVSVQALLCQETVSISRVLMREMARPTAAFQIIFDGPLKQFHGLIARLIAVYLDADPASERIIVLAHTVFGQVLGFRAARELVLRVAGWKNFGDRERALIAETVEENVEVLLSGLRRRRRRSAKKN